MAQEDPSADILERLERAEQLKLNGHHREALALLEECHSATEIDAAMLAAGYRLGPFPLIDLPGADINLAPTNGPYAAMGKHPR